MENKQKLKRPIQRIVRLSEEENNLIKRKIEESFFPNFQNFALHLLIQGEIRHVDYSELNRLTTEILIKWLVWPISFTKFRLKILKI